RLLPFALLLAGCAADPAPSPPLPKPPDGVKVRVVAAFEPGDQEPVRIAAHPDGGKLYVLGGGGDVFLLDPDTGKKRRVLAGAEYIVDQPKRQDVNIPLPIDAKWVNAPITLRATLCLGLCYDREKRLYAVANVQVPGKVMVNRVDLYRTDPVGADGVP